MTSCKQPRIIIVIITVNTLHSNTQTSSQMHGGGTDIFDMRGGSKGEEREESRLEWLEEEETNEIDGSCHAKLSMT